jgi:AcrR family transcriptional regulator
MVIAEGYRKMAESRPGIGNVMPNKSLVEMAMGYSRSRILCAAARLGVADAMGDEARSVDEIAGECGANSGSLYRLLRALASFGVVAETSPRQFVLTAMGRPLRKDAPNSQWAGVVFWADLLADSWAHLTECVRTGENAAKIMEREGIASRWSKDPDARAIFGAVMGTAPAEDYAPIARAWDFSGFGAVADLGGGNGGLISAVLSVYPNVRGMLVDHPEYIEKAALRLEKEGLSSRCKAMGADLCQGVPSGADVYMMKHVLHGYGDEAAVNILKHCRSALPANGRVLVIEFVLPDVVDHADAGLEQRLTSDLNMLAVTEGKERSAEEWKPLLGEAEMECRGIIAVPRQLVSIIEAAGRA